MINSPEAKEVLEIIESYKKGSYEADTALLNQVFHEKAVMNGYLGPDLLLADPSAFIGDIGSSPSMKSNDDPYEVEILQVHVEGDIASVVIKETGFRGVATLVDCFHLIKIDGKWSIISKLFTTV